MKTTELGKNALKLNLFLFAILCFSNGTVPAYGNRNKPGPERIMQVAFIMSEPSTGSDEEKIDLESLKTPLSVQGIRFTGILPKKISKNALEKFDIIILPNISAKYLKPDKLNSIRAAVNSGSNIVFDGESALVEKLGIEIEKKPINVEEIRDLQFKDIPLYWRTPAKVRPVVKSPNNDLQVLCIEESSKAPLVVSGKYGKGKFIYFSPLFDPESGKGYSRFPYLIEMLSKVFGYERLAQRKIAAMYYDPGNRDFQDIENTVKLWRKNGVHTVYAGGWYGREFDYEKLIRFCHQNGILVCCWLELPMAGKEFWDEHPQWREKTAVLKDAKIDWRYLVNLANEDCRIKVFKNIEELLNKYDWDGVNLSELYFESTEGTKDPDRFTPMNDDIRREFKDEYGFDPLDIFDKDSGHYWKANNSDWEKFADFRISLCNRIKAYCLELLAEIRKNKKDFEIIITAMDASSSPFLEYNIAEDTDYLLKLQEKYDLTLQVQDEWMFWNGKPERYFFLGNYYRQYVSEPHRFELDFNVVECHEKGEGGLPSQKPSGEEVRQVVYNMGLNNARPVFYAEDSIYEQDFENINTVLARDVSVLKKSSAKWEINTQYKVEIRTAKKGQTILMDGRIWRAGYEDAVVVPRGRHTLRFLPQPANHELLVIKPRLIYISAELISANFFDNSVELSYEEYYSSCYLILNRKPEQVFIDNKLEYCPVYEDKEGSSVKLPSGNHSVKIFLPK